MKPIGWRGLFGRDRCESATPGGLLRGPDTILSRLRGLARGRIAKAAAPDAEAPAPGADGAAKPRLRRPRLRRRQAPVSG